MPKRHGAWSSGALGRTARQIFLSFWKRLFTLVTATMKKEAANKCAGAAKALSTRQRDELLQDLQERFEKNMKRHPGLEWQKVLARLEAAPEKPGSLFEMERTGGEPDVTGYDKKTGEFLFVDCSQETPEGRRSRGHRDVDRRRVPGAAEVRGIRSQDFMLGQNSRRHPKTRRCAVWRSSLWPRLHQAQRRAVLLQHQGVPWLLTGLGKIQGMNFDPDIHD